MIWTTILPQMADVKFDELNIPTTIDLLKKDTPKKKTNVLKIGPLIILQVIPPMPSEQGVLFLEEKLVTGKIKLKLIQAI